MSLGMPHDQCVQIILRFQNVANFAVILAQAHAADAPVGRIGFVHECVGVDRLRVIGEIHLRRYGRCQP